MRPCSRRQRRHDCVLQFGGTGLLLLVVTVLGTQAVELVPVRTDARLGDALVAATPTELKCDSFLTHDNTTCVISSRHTYTKEVWLVLGSKGKNVEMHFGGVIESTDTHAGSQLRLQITGHLILEGKSTLTSKGNLLVDAMSVTMRNSSVVSGDESVDVETRDGGSVLITEGASIKSSQGDVSVVGVGVHLIVGSSITAHGYLTVSGLDIANPVSGGCVGGIFIGTHSVMVGASVKLTCRKGTISVASLGTISATDSTESVGFEAGEVYLDDGSTVRAAGISVDAQTGNANITGALPGLPGLQPTGALHGLPIATPVLCVVNATSQATLTLGQPGGGPWTLQELRAFAGSITVLPNQAITTQGPDGAGSNCNNSPNVVEDICQKILMGSGASNIFDPTPPPFNVSFDLLLAVRDKLEILADTRLSSASVMLCAGSTASFEDGSQVNAEGRGCGPGMGYGHGESRDPYVGCGAGGGSHLGSGGKGGDFKSQSLVVCAWAGPAYDFPSDTWSVGMTSTTSASGGGCGFPGSCSQSKYPSLYTVQHPSAGGGLIWLSAQKIDFVGKVTFNADGTPGTSVPYNSHTMVSGGGSGGQILLYAHDVDATNVILSAKGADTLCSTNQVGGAGGGGFIGLQWKGSAIKPSVAAAFHHSVKGGGISEVCDQYLPKSSQTSDLTGEDGQVLPLGACGSGYFGLFCAACPAGKYNDRKQSECYPCANKPTYNSVYLPLKAWPNSSCHFVCSDDVPNVLSNPKCMNAMEYAVQVYGGRTGLLCVLCCLVLFGTFLVCRRSRVFRKRMFLSSQPRYNSFTAHLDSVGHQGHSRWGIAVWFCCKRCRNPEKTVKSESVLTFTKEQLPFHLGRVYLYGCNCSSRPWAIDDKVPAIVEDLVVGEKWEKFASEINTEAETDSTEAYWERILQVCYPPVLPMYRSRRRQLRARRLECVTHKHCEGKSDGDGHNVALWRPIRARNQQGAATGQLVMTFGYDSGATLAYLDFFDFSLSQFDWAPADLGKEARLLVAHGHGSYSEPFALDPADPVVGALTHAGLGVTAVYSAISKFNQVSRLIPPSEVDAGEGHLIQLLRKKVFQNAAECGLTGCVQVLVVHQFTVRTSQELPPAAPARARPWGNSGTESFSDLMEGLRQVPTDRRDIFESPADAAAENSSTTGNSSRSSEQHSDRWQSKNRSIQTRTTASTMYTPSDDYRTSPPHSPPQRHDGDPASMQTIDTPLSPRLSTISNLGGSGIVAHGHHRCVEARLCLAFGNFSALLHRGSRGHDDMSGSVSRNSSTCSVPRDSSSWSKCPAPLVSALTSPIPNSILSDHLQAAVERSPQPVRRNDFNTPPKVFWRLRLTAAYLSCRLCVWRGSFRGANLGSWTPSTCLLLLVVLFFADMMVFLMIGYLLYVAAKAEPMPGFFIVALWLMVPPLTQPLAAITGPMFAIIEDPRLGRLFAGATALGIANSSVLLVAILWFYRGSFYFDILEFTVACCVKVALFIVANVHISNLEIAHDLSFMESSKAQSDFLERRPSNVAPDLAADEQDLTGRSVTSLPESLLDDPLVAHMRPLFDSGVAETAPTRSGTSPTSSAQVALPRNNSKGSPKFSGKPYNPSPF